jgi:hypothetical protein
MSACFAGCGGGGSVTISTTSPLPSGTINVAYATTLAASGGKAPYTWSSSGTLPKGLTLSSAGTLSGTPTVAGPNSFSITVSDSESHAKTATLAATLFINDSAVTITTGATLPAGTVGSAYSQTLAATGGTAPYTWTVASGTLPAGLALSSGGVVSGTPTAAGSSTFTIQATDSASTAKTATLAATLVVNPPPTLAITTASPLPSGTVGTPYAGVTFAATGGVPPYKWSIPAGSIPPPGLSLSSGGVLSGTPTGPDGRITVEVADSETTPQTATQTFSQLISPKVGPPIQDGTYAFVFAGTSPQGSPAGQNAINLNGTFTIQDGTVLSGFYDENTNNGSLLAEQPITGGTLVDYTDGLGTLTLDTGATSGITFSLAIPATGSDIRMIEFDDTTGAGARGSGVLKFATSTPTLPTGPGSFAFLVSATNAAQAQEALVCSFQIDGTSNANGGLNIVSLKADANEITAAGARSMDTWTSGASTGVAYGSLAMDSHGRGLLTFKLGVIATFHFSFYEVSPTEWFVNSADAATVLQPLASGTVLAQTGSGSFSAASFPAVSVLEANGLAPSASTTAPDVVLGLATSDGSGKLSFAYDEYNGALATGQTLSGSYTVDSETGRSIDSSDATQPILYIVDSSKAFILFTGNSALSGILEQQTGGSFTNSSFSGNYLGGSLALSNTDVLNEAGLATADGAGNFTSVGNQSTSAGLTLYWNEAGTYSVDSTGRVVATAPDGATRIFYIVSPGKVAYLTSDQGGYLGSFEQ